jgi:serine/threonine-protein kinase RIO1
MTITMTVTITITITVTGYSKSNPRKMVKMWAEKEMRNLKRLKAAGIPCPTAIHLRNHVLLMTFIGEAVIHTHTHSYTHT